MANYKQKQLIMNNGKSKEKWSSLVAQRVKRYDIVTVMAWVQSLVLELPHAIGVAKKKKKSKEKWALLYLIYCYLHHRTFLKKIRHHTSNNSYKCVYPSFVDIYLTSLLGIYVN